MPDTLTTAQATFLYNKGLAIVEGTWRLTTRTAEYEWSPNEQRYEQLMGGLRIVHRIGAQWKNGRFVRCHCTTCERYHTQAAEVDIAWYPTEDN